MLEWEFPTVIALTAIRPAYACGRSGPTNSTTYGILSIDISVEGSNDLYNTH